MGYNNQPHLTPEKSLTLKFYVEVDGEESNLCAEERDEKERVAEGVRSDRKDGGARKPVLIWLRDDS